MEYYITTKMDGSSHSVSIDEDGFHVTGHNYEYKDDGKSAFYMSVDELMLERDLEKNKHIDIVVIASSDHGYASSVSAAKARGKQAVVIGGEKTAKKLKDRCSKYICIH